MPRFTAILLALFFTGGAVIAHADDLEEVIVTGRSIEETIPLVLADYGSRLEVIEFKEIENMGFVDVGQVLQMLVPGLHLRPKNGAFDYVDVSLQGSRREEILWLIDGVRINNRLYNGTTPLDTIPVHIIERIEILKGGQGIFYGTQSVGGVINIVTKTLQDESNGEAGVGVNTNEGYDVNAYYQFASGRQRFMVYASRDAADGFQPYRDSDFQPSATDRERGYEVNVAGFKYGLNLSERTTLSMQYQHTWNKLDFIMPTRNARTVNERDEDILTAKFDFQPSDKVGFFVKAYYHNWDTYYTSVFNDLDDDGNPTGDLDVIDDRTFWGYEDYGLNAMMELRLNKGFEYVLGFDNQSFSGVDDVWRIARQREHVNALFGQVRTTPDLFANTKLALGIRYNHPDNVQNSTVWNVSGRHEFTDQWYLEANVGTSFRLPDAEALFLNEIYDEDGDGIPDDFFSIGNPNLEGEKSHNWNIGVGADFDGASFELIGYKRRISNYIASYVPVYIEGVEGESFINSDDEVKVNGLELIVNVALADEWNTQISYNHTNSELNNDGVQLTGIPENEAKWSLNFDSADQPWGAALAAIYVGKFNARPGVERGNYFLMDLSAYYRFGKAKSSQVVMRLENVTDAVYATRVDVATADHGGNYFYDSLGTPRTLSIFYNYTF